jgi:CspA family cold shock protein
LGQVIGKQGRIVEAMRIIMSAATAKDNKRCVLEVAELAPQAPHDSPSIQRNFEEHRFEKPTEPRPRAVSEDRDARGSRQGVVKWFNAQKGYGFIAADDGGDVFLHHSALRGPEPHTISEGDRVSFTSVRGEKGLKAINVLKIGAGSVPGRQ